MPSMDRITSEQSKFCPKPSLSQNICANLFLSKIGPDVEILNLKTLSTGVVCLLPPTFQPPSWSGFLRMWRRWDFSLPYCFSVDNCSVSQVAEAAEAGELMFGTVDSWLVWNLTGGLQGGRWVLWYFRRLQNPSLPAGTWQMWPMPLVRCWWTLPVSSGVKSWAISLSFPRESTFPRYRWR